MIFFVTWQTEMFPYDVGARNSGETVQPFSPEIPCLPDASALKYFFIKGYQPIEYLLDYVQQ